MTTFARPFVAKNGVEPGSNNVVNIGSSDNQFLNVYSNTFVVSGGLANSSDVIVYANGHIESPSANINSITADIIEASNLTVTYFESTTTILTELESNTVVADNITANVSLNFASANQSPNVNITVNGDVQGVATAELTNLTNDASLDLTLELTDTGVVSGSYGNATYIPILSIDVDGRITSANEVAVAGVSNFVYESSNAQFVISTADGGSFEANLDLAAFDTDDLAEGNNLYYTTARANTDIDARVTETFVSALNVDAQTVFGNTASDLLNFNNFTNLPSPNVSITVNGDMTGVATADIANLASDADISLDITLNANQTFEHITSNTITVDSYIDLEPIPHPAGHTEGRFHYDSVHKTLNFQNDITNIDFELGTNEYIRVYNDTGSAIPKGAALYLSGYTSTDPVVPKAVLADATSAETYNTSGLAAASIADGAYGYCAVSGVVRGDDSDPFDTSYLTPGQRAFVSATTPGNLQQPAPSYPNFPMCMGLVVVSDANNGVFVVEQQMHAVPQFRVAGDAYVGADLTVAGDFTVLGTETTVSLQNIAVDDTFFYLGSGDTIANTEYVPADANTPGLNDATYSGYYEGLTSKTISVRIDSTGATDTFEWSDDNFVTTGANNVAITGSAQDIVDNIKITFSATTGHTLGDRWDGDVAPSDLDFGLIGNYSNSTLYSHAGWFRDASDRRFKFFKRYDPEIEGTVDTTNSSFEYADLQVNTIYGHTFSGNVTGTVTGTVSDISNHDTDDLTEGNTNLYYTTARANTDIDARVTTSFVNALDADAQTVFGNTAADLLNFNNFTNLPSPNVSITVNGDVQGVATADIANLASDAEISLSLELTDTGVVANTYGNSTSIPVITVDVDGRITAANVTTVAGVSSFTYESSNAQFVIGTADGSSFEANLDLTAFDTDDVTEGNTNLYYTEARANSAIDARVTNTFIENLTIDYGSLSNAPANTSTSNVEFTSSNNTLTFTRADSSTFNVTGPFLPDTLVLENTTDGASISNSVNTIAIGANSSISGDFSNRAIVIGTDASSIANDSVVIGTGATATGTGGLWGMTAVGWNAYANGYASTAYGREALANGNYSTALGPSSRAAGYGVAIGPSANGAAQAVAIGYNSNAPGGFSMAIGASSNSIGNSVSIGHSAYSAQSNNVTIGNRVRSLQRNSVTIGANGYNDGIDSVTIGWRANNEHDYGVTIGRLATTQGAANWKGVAVGMSAAVYANSGIAIGSQANSSAEFAVAIGQQVTADVANTIFLGDTNYDVKIQGTLLHNQFSTDSNTATIATANTATLIDDFDATVYRSAKYFIQGTSNTGYQSIEVIVLHDGNTSYVAEYGEIYSNASFFTLDSSVNGSNVELTCTTTDDDTTIHLTRQAVVV